MAKVPEYFFTQSGVIPYRVDAGHMEVLLIGSRKNKRWVIPKGVREPDLSARISAAREALEEAGIEGNLATAPIGSYRYRKWGGQCKVEVFPMAVTRVHDRWPEEHRRRKWLTVDEAACRVKEKKLGKLIHRLPGHVAATRNDEHKD